MAKGHVLIDFERCKGCELCASVCPKGGIKMSEQFNAKGYRPAVWLNPDGACTGCALCALICPDTAITVYREVVPRMAVVKAAHN
ncbi:MAG: 4Fe-4S dicluster domain-containing protein [Anaerolineae bacterium]|nr:4Fe-4S dicluster domain-containing protein [Thermoflexales bacterium]MDW8408850.1 4Fe-4S dicluster domain-containing protein [Anaerolineae bacterium]